MSEWQKIETAPKDGTWILGHGDGPAISQCPYIISWDCDENLRESWMEIYSEQAVTPTHWQPLPEPPKE
jgi:hypothetical protein